MRFSDESQARSALCCRARTSRAPAVLLSVGKDGTFRLVEADAEGHVTLKSTEELYEYRWTDHRGMVESITLVNRYSVALVSYTEYENFWPFMVPHGTNDLEATVRTAIEQAREDPSWKRTYTTRPIKAVGMCESEFVDTCSYDLPVPDGLSDDKDKPTILIEMTAGGRINDVRLLSGQAHLAVLDPARQLLDLYRHERHDGQDDFLYLQERIVDGHINRLVNHAIRRRSFDLPDKPEPDEIPF